MVGHLSQGRYKAILIQKEAHLLELSRYVVLNPVRAQMVERAEDWLWSSYPFVMNDIFTPEWLDSDWLLRQFGQQRAAAWRAYQQFVLQGCCLPSPLLQTEHQLPLGDETFVKQFHAQLNDHELRELSIAHKRSLALSLGDCAEQASDRNAAMVATYRSGAYTMGQIADYFQVHYMTVSRAIRSEER